MPQSFATAADGDIPLSSIPSRKSIDSVASSEFGHLLSDHGSEVSDTHQDVPPADGGRGAWLFLAGNWLLEATAWAFTLSFGVFQSYYSKHELFKESQLIPSIGTFATGISYLGMPFTNPIALRWPQHRRKMMITGFGMCVSGLVGASFATQAWHLLIFQGLLYGVGWVVCYTPFLFMLNEWFIERRGLAYGILFSGAGVSGLVIPLAVDWLLQTFGFRTALRTCAITISLVGGCGIMLMRPRYKSHSAVSHLQQKRESSLDILRTYAKNHDFILLNVAVVLQGFGFFVPYVFLPVYAQDAGLSTMAGSVLLAIISAFATLGQLSQGWISDRVNVWVLTTISTSVSGLAAISLWAYGRDTLSLSLFSAIWGLLSSSFTVLFTRMCTAIMSGTHETSDQQAFMTMYAMLSVCRGVSNILEGPISGVLVSFDDDLVSTRLGMSRYSKVVLFTSGCMILSASVAGLKFILYFRNRGTKHTR